MSKLIKPTVDEMIAELLKLPGGAPFVISDPDTGWMIDTFYLDVGEQTCPRAIVSAEYSDMDSTWGGRGYDRF